MSELARQLIEENLRTRHPVLDLGNCGLKLGTEDELYRPLANADHLEKLIFSTEWYEYDKERAQSVRKESQNKGIGNALIQLPAGLLAHLQTLIIAGIWNSSR